jgi:hypothetical protein
MGVEAAAVSPDHHEFEASLYAPFRGVSEAREFRLFFRYVDAVDPSTVVWRVEISTPDGTRLLRSWVGEERLHRAPLEIALPWNGRGADGRIPDPGFYRARLTAVAGEPSLVRDAGRTLDARVASMLEGDAHAIVQEWEILVGAPPRVRMPEFRALPVGTAQEKAAFAEGALPYTIYYGNLHTQSNDSDGGGAIATCVSSQGAQNGAFGPGTGFAYARDHGLDFSMASEHNHYFDGSSGTNGSASPAVVRARYAAGLDAAASVNAASPGFLALYGMEWGVIANGGHMNILGSTELFAWEYNNQNQLLGDVFTPKSDYPAIYATMRARNLVGQFNHPDFSDDQFIVDGTVFGYHADGDEVMVLAEIQNTSAFSSNTTETETSRSRYEGAYKRLLESGFHVAPATNQDNHCANWGASWTNRTAVLIPTGEPLTTERFIAALRARRVFATSDKHSQLIFTGNGHLMGERFVNAGPLALVAQFANSQGRTITQAEIHQGVPGRNGTVTVLANAPTHTFTPAIGEHFYYARLTQDDGKVLWSAPIWVTQQAVDSTPPSVVAGVAGGSGTIAFSATATDNVGVAAVTFAVDGVDRGSDSEAPYSLAFDSALLADGAHSLVARATDAAGNVGSSAPVSFDVDNAPPPDDVFANGFE